MFGLIPNCTLDNLLVIDVVKLKGRLKVVLHTIDNCWGLDRMIISKVNLKVVCLSIKDLLSQGSLRFLGVSSTQSLNLFLLETSIEIVKTFSTGSRSRGQIFEDLELPVGPSSQDFIALVEDLIDLLSACIRVVASSEFRHDERNLQSFGIVSSCLNPQLMPLLAVILSCDVRLT